MPRSPGSSASLRPRRSRARAGVDPRSCASLRRTARPAGVAFGSRTMLERYAKRILEARVYDVAVQTPLSPAQFLSARLDNQVLIKREDLQPIYSFKIRGAYNKIARLSDEERRRGVICASAGNHAQGVAMAAAHLGVKAHIVMGTNTPEIKVNAVRARGAHVILHGDGYDQASAHARSLMDKHGYAWVPPFDDPDTIAGQGTVGMEILRQHSGPIDAIFVPVGGGGLIAGIAAYVKYLRPEIRIIGVESEGSACLAAAMKAGRRVKLPIESLDLFADGVSVAQIGKETWKVARHHVDEVVTVTTDEICAAVKDVFEDTRALSEPAGALSIAGMKKWVAQNDAHDMTLVAINSGANVNFDRLRHIAERADVGEQREAILAVTIDEKPGSFRRFCRIIGKRAVTEFNYRYADPTQAHVFVGVSVSPAAPRAALVESLRSQGYPVTDMTDNEMAKLHVRHLVGGRAPGDHAELLFRFEFPERPGALMKFLTVLGERWNISLFHYRNHGSAWGRVLVGFQAEAKELRALRASLNATGYRFWEETDNPAYEQFLS
ncbi:MAG TPA: threonine ammonia-lyase, biosynthetic [Pseudomonadales bacterium]|nr:threonine ammonia-lyase, biosynthetic [Pseudomonadales bacterium]